MIEVLESAVSGGATDVVTSDRDLLVLNPFRNTKIVTVQEFMLAEMSDK
jgi:uncharacterized protein